MREIIDFSLVDTYLSYLTLYKPKAEAYIRRNVKNYILRNFPTSEVSYSNYLNFLPEELISEKALDRIDVLIEFARGVQQPIDLEKIKVLKKIKDKSGTLKDVQLLKIETHPEFTLDLISHVLDYLIIHGEETHFSISFEDAIKKTKMWDERREREVNKEKEVEGLIEEVMVFENGLKIVKLIDKKAYIREGYLMKHCVSSYHPENDLFQQYYDIHFLFNPNLEKENSEVYSLRDDKNMPLVTIEIVEGRSREIREKRNATLSAENGPYVNEFLKSIKPKVKIEEKVEELTLGIEPINLITSLLKLLKFR